MRPVASHRPRRRGGARRVRPAAGTGAVAGRRRAIAWRCSSSSTSSRTCIRTTSAGTRTAWRRRRSRRRRSGCAVAGCITLSRDLADMEAAAGPPVSRHRPGDRAGLAACRRGHQHGGRRPRPRLLRGAGLPARSVGSAPLGRRIYLGPFATQGALDGARDLGVPRRVPLPLSGAVLMRRPGPRRRDAGGVAAAGWAQRRGRRPGGSALRLFDDYDRRAGSIPTARSGARTSPS